MKTHLTTITIVVLTGCALVALAQTEASDDAQTQPSQISTSRTFIPGALDVPAFPPPAPPAEKTVPAMRIDSAVTVPAANSRTLTLLRGEASTLPDIPVPPASVPQESRALTPEEIARNADHRRHSLQLGATVFDHRLSVVHWQHPDTGESYEAACGFDIGLLAGIGQFVRNGETYSVMLTHSAYNTVNFRNAVTRLFPDLPGSSRIFPDLPGSSRIFPDLPEVPSDSIIYLKGNPNDATGTAPITLLRDLIASEKTRLTTYQEDRATYQKTASEWAKAHPVVPRDETFWLRPHRGSRYLADPKPEATAR